MGSRNYDLIDLLFEDLNVGFRIDATKNDDIPHICWSSYLMSTVFRGATNLNGKFSNTDMVNN